MQKEHIKRSVSQEGSVYFWKYKTDGWLGTEWHFTADTKGCADLIELFDRMNTAAEICETVLPVTPVTPEILDIPDYDSPYKNMSEIDLVYFPFQSHYYEWDIIVNRDKVEIKIGRAMLQKWLQAATDVQKGIGNYSIGLHEDHTVFIWPHP